MVIVSVRRGFQYHGKGMEEKCLALIKESMGNNHLNELLITVMKNTYLDFKIPVQTMRNWWTHFLEWGEYPYETRQREKDVKKLMKKFHRTEVITINLINCVKGIVDLHPE